MAPSEMKRLALFEKLVEVLEEEPAVTLMEHLPPAGWVQVATKADLGALEERINGRFAEFEGRMKVRFAEVNTRIDTGLAEVNTRIGTGLAEVNTRIGTGLAEVNTRIDTGLAETHKEMLRAINRQTYIWTTALVGALLAYFLAGPGLA